MKRNIFQSVEQELGPVQTKYLIWTLPQRALFDIEQWQADGGGVKSSFVSEETVELGVLLNPHDFPIYPVWPSTTCHPHTSTLLSSQQQLYNLMLDGRAHLCLSPLPPSSPSPGWLTSFKFFYSRSYKKTADNSKNRFGCFGLLEAKLSAILLVFK